MNFKGKHKLRPNPRRPFLPNMILRRFIRSLALLMTGDRMSGLVKPRWHSLLWDIGAESFRLAMGMPAENPTKARRLYAVEVGVGALPSARQASDGRRLF